MRLAGLAIDVDGTLTEDGGRIDLEAAHAIRWLEELGYAVFLVSGRGLWDLFALAVYLGTERTVVAENGGVIADSPVEAILLDDGSTSLRALEVLANELADVKLRRSFPRLTEVVLERTFNYQDGIQVLRTKAPEAALSDSKYGYHLLSARIDKGLGLRRALLHHKLPPERIVAIGDSETDEPMFAACGYSIALGNAPERTKDAANHSTYAGFGEGLVEAVRHVALHFLRLTSEDRNA